MKKSARTYLHPVMLSVAKHLARSLADIARYFATLSITYERVFSSVCFV